MGKRIVGYVISHSGKPGGPWEAMGGRFGTPTLDPSERISVENKQNLQFMLCGIQRLNPAARILRLVRRERHRAEEAAVVEAAMAWEAAGLACLENKDIAQDDYLAGTEFRARHMALQTCAALRAKRGG